MLLLLSKHLECHARYSIVQSVLQNNVICLEAITGPQLQFFDVVASWPGSSHDSRIFENSRARVLYEERKVPGFLLGDMGYGCLRFLMTPLAEPGAPNSPGDR